MQLSKRFEREAADALQRNQIPPEVSKFLAGEDTGVSEQELEDMKDWFGDDSDEEEHIQEEGGGAHLDDVMKRAEELETKLVAKVQKISFTPAAYLALLHL